MLDETPPQPPIAAPPDDDAIARVRAGDPAAFEPLMRRHNRRLYRALRSILRDEADVEDAMQETYVLAFRGLATFEGRASFQTWLLRIGTRHAWARAAQRRSREGNGESEMDLCETVGLNPEQAASDEQARAMLEQAIDTLPEGFRTVFVLRDVEELSIHETAACLAIPEETVKTRLHRARRHLRRALEQRVAGAVHDAFDFRADRCNRVVAAVFQRVAPGVIHDRV